MDFMPKGAKRPAVLKPYTPRILKPIEFMTYGELMNGKGGTLVFDVESYRKYFLIAFKHVETHKVLMFECRSEKGQFFNARLLSWIMHNYTVVGFNSNDFDIPLIWLAISYQDNPTLFEVTEKLIYQGYRASDLVKEYNFVIPKQGIRHIDLIEVCPLNGSLKTYGARLHAERLQDLPFDPQSELTLDEEIQTAHYCVNDLDLTIADFKELKEELALREILSIEYKQDLMSKSNAQLSEAIISGELRKLTGKKPEKQKNIGAAIHYYRPPSKIVFQTEPLKRALEIISSAQYEVLENGRLIVPEAVEKLPMHIGRASYRIGNGGLHSSEKNAGHRATETHFLRDVDFSSFYPRIIINAGMFPKQLGPNFLKVYNDIYTRRLAAKKAKNYSVSETLKIALNGAFGKLGSPYSILYSPELLIQVTVTGQLILLMMIEALELNCFQVVSANTDGIVIKGERSRSDECNALCKAWGEYLDFELEFTEYAAIYSRDVNNYIAIKEKNKEGKTEVKGKGAYLNPWHGAQVSGNKLNIFRFHKNPMTTICIEAATRHMIDGTPIEKTIKESRDIRQFTAVKKVDGGAHKDGHYLGKVVRWYYAKEIVGTINYIRNGHTVSDTEGAKPCMDLPDEFPEDINYAWYIAYTNRILTDLDYIQKPREITFF